ncbi:hypothetical protein [Marinoscillum sp.]|uniref:hypothetical protein n=1 Tax=Marinoscillum sp. TaxID=2024838 RepID=UPI003872E8B7
MGLVFTIWSVVVVRFVNFSPDSDETLLPIRVRSAGLTEESSQSYRFKLNYADPFLKEEEQAKPPQEEVAIKNVEIAQAFAVKYKGMVSGHGSAAGIIMLNNKSIIIKEGDTIDEYRILDVARYELRILHISLDSTLTIRSSN